MFLTFRLGIIEGTWVLIYWQGLQYNHLQGAEEPQQPCVWRLQLQPISGLHRVQQPPVSSAKVMLHFATLHPIPVYLVTMDLPCLLGADGIRSVGRNS